MHSRWQRVTTAGILVAAAAYAGFLLAPVVVPHASPTATLRRGHPAHRVAVGLQAGDYPPNFTLEDIHGHTVTLWDLRGRAVWLNFWATWCPWCRREMPLMERMHQHYGNRIAIYGIDLQESRSTVVRWLAAHGIHYDVLLDTTGGVATAYDVSQLPTSVFIGPDGRITAIHVGALLSPASMVSLIQQAMANGHG